MAISLMILDESYIKINITYLSLLTSLYGLMVKASNYLYKRLLKCRFEPHKKQIISQIVAGLSRKQNLPV